MALRLRVWKRTIAQVFCFAILALGLLETFLLLRLGSPAVDSFYTLTGQYERRCLTKATSGNSMSNEVEGPMIITVADSPNVGYRNFLYSLQLFGYSQVKVLSFTFVDGKVTEEQYWKKRLETVIVFIRSLPRDRILCLVDAFDTLFLVDSKDLLSRYRRHFNGKVVIAAEALCDTPSCRLDNLQKSKLLLLASTSQMPNAFPNAGGMMGNAGNLLSFLQCVDETMSKQPSLDDQTAISLCLLSELSLHGSAQSKYVLDYHEVLFSVPTARMQHKSSEVNSSAFAPKSAIIHFAGMRWKSGGSVNFCQSQTIKHYNFIGSKLDMGKNRPDKRRLVVSLTTMPLRLPLVHITIQSIMDQRHKPDVIYLNLPRELPYDANLLGSLKTNFSILQIVTCDDVGPATKLIPTLKRETHPNTLIVTVDDDMAYKPNTISVLVEHHIRWDHAAFGFAGQNLDKDGAVRSADTWRDAANAVDILEAFLGAIYRRDFFDDRIFEIPNECKKTDDIWISAHLSMKGIPRIKLQAQSEDDRAVFTKNDVISPLRSANVFAKQGMRLNDVCAQHVSKAIKQSWVAREECSLDFSPLPSEIIQVDDIFEPRPVALDRDPHYLIGACSPSLIVARKEMNQLAMGVKMLRRDRIMSPSDLYSFGLLADGQACVRKRTKRLTGSSLFSCQPLFLQKSRFFAVVFERNGKLCFLEGDELDSRTVCSKPVPVSNWDQTWSLTVDDKGKLAFTNFQNVTVKVEFGRRNATKLPNV